MLTEIGLKNFKAFGDTEQRVPLSKITLIYGPNSGGKSSILQALLMLKQSLTTRGKQRSELTLRGDLVDLGSFQALLHRHDTERELGIRVGYRNPEFGADGPNVDVGMSFSEMDGSGMLSAVTFTINSLNDNDDLFYAVTKRSEGPIGDLNDEWTTSFTIADAISVFQSQSVLRDDQEFLPTPVRLPELKVARDRALGSAQPWLLERETHIELESMDPVQRTPLEEENEEDDSLRRELDLSVSRQKAIEQAQNRAEMRKGIVQTELEHWNSTHQQVVALLPENVPLDYERYLASIIYLGPLRSYPQRIYSLTDLGDDESTGVQGHLAPNALYGRPGSLDRLNAWFERFQIPYDLHIDRIARTELAGEYIVMVLRDRRSGTQVTIADVGFGINQILPVITEGVTSRPGSIICVEQPEIHLHPRLQAHLADLMIDTISEYDGEGKQWIAETHSELLILRIQRRIREGRLTSEDVSVIYVDPDEDGAGSNILQLDLDEEGNFVDEWPEGFFDEGFNELMADPEVDGM